MWYRTSTAICIPRFLLTPPPWQAVKAVQKKQFDVVLMDGFMPNKTGWDATKEIRQIEQDRGEKRPLIIVGVTGATTTLETQKCLEAGMTETICKPIDRVTLHRNISMWMEQHYPKCEPKQSSGLVATGSAAAAQLVPVSELEDLRVLVVDDDAGQRIMLKAMLSKDNFKVDTADNGAEAVKLTQRGWYHAVLMDGFMPIMTGWDATKEIRAREKNENSQRPLTIIGITGATSREDGIMCKESGMTDYITKPVSREKLRAKIFEYCDKVPKNPTSAPKGKEAIRNPLPQLATPPAPAPLPVKLDFDFKIAGPRHGRKLKALVVDPDAGQKLVLKALLQRMGMEITACSSGAEGLTKMGEVGFDLSIVIIDMVTMSGAEFAQEVRRRGSLAHPGSTQIPLIGVVSAKAKEDPETSRFFSAVIFKPYDKVAIDGMVSKVMAESASASDGAAAPAVPGKPSPFS